MRRKLKGASHMKFITKWHDTLMIFTPMLELTTQKEHLIWNLSPSGMTHWWYLLLCWSKQHIVDYVLNFWAIISEETLNDLFLEIINSPIWNCKFLHWTLFIFAAQWLDNKTGIHDVEYINRATSILLSLIFIFIHVLFVDRRMLHI